MAGASRFLLAAVLGVLLISRSAVAEAPDGCAMSAYGSTARSCGQGLSWSYDAASRVIVQRGSTVGSLDANGRKVDYVVGARCEQGVMCGASAFTCPRLDSRSGIRYRAFAFAIDALGIRVYPPIGDASVCEYSGRSVPLAVVEAEAHEEIRKRIPVPSVVSSPPGHSLVNLFTIFSTVPAAEQAITFTTPVPGEVRAVPEYAWDFGDGLTGLGPGTPFDPEVLPSKNKGYYLGATYPKPGSKHVALTVTWRVTFRLEGITSVPLAPIVMTASEDKVITTAKAVLVR